MSQHLKLIKFLTLYDLMIDLQGHIKKNNKDLLLSFTLLLLNIFYIYVKLSLKTTIVLYSTSVYIKFVEYILYLNDINYINLIKPYISYDLYKTTDDIYISLSPQIEDFIDEEVPLMPLTTEEIENLEEHTGIKNLLHYQNQILSFCKTINPYQVIKNQYHNVIYSIHSFDFDNKFIQTNTQYKFDNKYKFDCILTDYTPHLQINEIINLSYYNNDNNQFYIENKYIVNNKYQLEPLSDGINDHIDPLPFYSLEKPRKQIVFHPYHLPKTVDYIMSIMILTQAFIENKLHS